MKEKEKERITYIKNKISTKLCFSYLLGTDLNYFVEVADEDLIKRNNLDDKDDSIIYEPMTKMIFDYEEIQKILKLNEENIYKFFYFNRKKVHKILYEVQETITVEYIEIKNLLSFCFYLYLLIKDNNNIINYSYSIDLIKKINLFQYNNNDRIYKKVLIAKIIAQLIENYKNDNEINIEEEDEHILNKIEEENKAIIKENLNSFSKIGLNMREDEIYTINVDEMYIEIIVSLIKEKKFDNYEEVYNIIEELDLENICLTKKMYNILSDELNSNESYINYYLIKNIEDLFDEKKINFYYILLKFIINNSIYIYKIPILFQMRKTILQEIKKICYNDIKENIKNKFDYIIEKITDSKYYLNIY